MEAEAIQVVNQTRTGPCEQETRQFSVARVASRLGDVTEVGGVSVGHAPSDKCATATACLRLAPAAAHVARSIVQFETAWCRCRLLFPPSRPKYRLPETNIRAFETGSG